MSRLLGGLLRCGPSSLDNCSFSSNWSTFAPLRPGTAWLSCTEFTDGELNPQVTVILWMCWYQLTWTPLQSWHLLDKIPKTHLQWHSLEGSWFAATFYCLPDQAHDLCVFSSWFWDMCWRHIKIVRVAWIYIYIQIYTHMAPQKKSRVAFIRIFAYIRICHIYYIYISQKNKRCQGLEKLKYLWLLTSCRF